MEKKGYKVEKEENRLLKETNGSWSFTTSVTKFATEIATLTCSDWLQAVHRGWLVVCTRRKAEKHVY